LVFSLGIQGDFLNILVYVVASVYLIFKCLSSKSEKRKNKGRKEIGTSSLNLMGIDSVGEEVATLAIHLFVYTSMISNHNKDHLYLEGKVLIAKPGSH
jgi:hypothetical protein